MFVHWMPYALYDGEPIPAHFTDMVARGIFALHTEFDLGDQRDHGLLHQLLRYYTTLL